MAVPIPRRTIYLDGKKYSVVGLRQGMAYRTSMVPIEDGDPSMERRHTWWDWSRGMGDGRGFITGSVSYAAGVHLPFGAIKLGPRVYNITFTGGTPTRVNDIEAHRGTVYIATDVGIFTFAVSLLARLAAGDTVTAARNTTERDVPRTEVFSLQTWRDYLFAALGSTVNYRVRTETGGLPVSYKWVDGLEKADVFGLSRMERRQEPTLVRGEGTQWSRYVCPLEPVDIVPAPDDRRPRDFLVEMRGDDAIIAWKRQTFTFQQATPASYQIQYRAPGATAWTTLPALVGGVTQTTHTFSRGSNFDTGTEWRMRAIFVGDSNEYWTPVQRLDPRTTDTNKVPVGIRMEPTEKSVTVTWFQEDTVGWQEIVIGPAASILPGGAPFDGLATQRHVLPRAEDDRAGTHVLPSSYTFYGLEPDTPYSVAIRGAMIAYGTNNLPDPGNWSDPQRFTTRSNLNCGEWGAPYEIRSPIRHLFAWSREDFAMCENGLYGFNSSGVAINSIPDLTLHPSPKNRWAAVFHDGILACTEAGLYHLIPGASQGTAGIEECEMDSLTYGPPQVVTVYGRWVYEARGLPGGKTGIIQYRMAEEGDTSFGSSITPVSIVDVFDGDVGGMTIIPHATAPWLIYNGGASVRAFQLTPDGQPANVSIPQVVSANGLDSIEDARATVVFSPTEFGTPEAVKYNRKVSAAGVGDDGVGIAIRVGDRWLPPQRERTVVRGDNPSIVAAALGADLATLRLQNPDVNFDAQLPLGTHVIYQPTMDFNGYAEMDLPVGTGDRRVEVAVFLTAHPTLSTRAKDIAVHTVTHHWEERPVSAEVIQCSLNLKPTNQEADRREVEQRRMDLQQLIDAGGPVEFIDADGVKGTCTVSALAGETPWDYEGERSDMMEIVIRKVRFADAV